MVPQSQDVDRYLGELLQSMTPPQPQPGITAIALRALDEMVEVCLAAEAIPADILSVVMDALANQALKASERQGRTIFPSELRETLEPRELGAEMAGTIAVLKHLAGRVGIDLPAAEAEHWIGLQAIPRERFYTDKRGTLRQRKSHVR